MGAHASTSTGKTVMPAMVELHAHLGYWNGPANTNLVENFTRENVLDYLQRFAYHGVAAAVSLGTDRRELGYDLRDEWRKSPPPNTALYFTAGQGLSSPGAGPGFPMRPAVYEVTTEADARKAVQEMVDRKVDRVFEDWHDAIARSCRRRFTPRSSTRRISTTSACCPTSTSPDRRSWFALVSTGLPTRSFATKWMTS